MSPRKKASGRTRHRHRTDRDPARRLRRRLEQGQAHRQGHEPGQFHVHFTEQHLVTNGASELFVEVFGDSGKHARSAFGVAQIPLGACVEIELIAELA
jgi:hypothetical protein